MTKQEEIQIKKIRQELFRLALESPDLEAMHWYIALDDCFENDYLSRDELGNMKWRCQVLSMKKLPVNNLLWMIDKLAQMANYNLKAIETGV